MLVDAAEVKKEKDPWEGRSVGRSVSGCLLLLLLLLGFQYDDARQSIPPHHLLVSVPTCTSG